MRTSFSIAGAALALAVASEASSQSLAERVSSIGDGRIQFTFAARPGVCGNGRGFIAIGSDTRIGSYSVDDGIIRESCDGGPVRVVVSRADGMIIALETSVGAPPATARESEARDLGLIAAREAAEYLLSVAAQSEGRPSRDAIMPAVLADGADVWQRLVALARDAARPRETRTTALTWLGRASGDLDAAPVRGVTAALVGIAGDRESPRPVREQAVSTLSRLPGGDGVPALMEMVGDAADPWLRRRAMTSLAGSGDPRVRVFLRQVAARDGVDDEVRYAAIRGLGGSYTTAQDMAFLRQTFARMTSSTAKDAVLAAAGEAGGRDNFLFLVNVAANPTETPTTRRRALQVAGREEAPIADLVALYGRVDGDLKEELISIYAKRSEAAAVDQLIQIARADEDRSLRRRAISALSKSEDPRVIAVLREIIVP
jgi:HEAT repeat protein